MNKTLAPNLPIGFYVITASPAEQCQDLFTFLKERVTVNSYAVKRVGDQMVIALSFKKTNSDQNTLQEILKDYSNNGVTFVYQTFPLYKAALFYCEQIEGWKERPYLEFHESNKQKKKKKIL